jgi:hypothetical protein
MNHQHRANKILARQVRRRLRSALGAATLALWAIVLLASWPAPAAAQPAMAEDLLQAIVARITVHTRTGDGLCHGFVATIRGDTAYIVTAKHCVETLSPTTIQRRERAPDLAVTIAYANGGTGSDRHAFWHIGSDDLVIAASFDRQPASYAGLCPNCISYRNLVPTGQPIPVLSVLSSAGGMPVLSTGMLLVTTSGEWIVLLPTAPGTSGAPVIDLRGNLVGVVSSATVVRGTQAGVMVELVPGAITADLVRYSVEQVDAASSSVPLIPPSIPMSPSPRPPVFSTVGLPGHVLRVSSDQTTFVMLMDRNGQQVYLSSPVPCQGINEDDPVFLYVDLNSDTVRMSTPNQRPCYLRSVADPQ